MELRGSMTQDKSIKQPVRRGRLHNKIALITGGSSGIGAASVRLFAREGATVIFVGRSSDKAQMENSTPSAESCSLKCM